MGDDDRKMLEAMMELLAHSYGVILYAVFPNESPGVTACFPEEMSELEAAVQPPHLRGSELEEVTDDE